MKRYIVRIAQSGDELEEYGTLEEAIECIKRFEDEDRDEGNYERDFYEVIKQVGTDYEIVW